MASSQMAGVTATIRNAAIKGTLIIWVLNPIFTFRIRSGKKILSSSTNVISIKSAPTHIRTVPKIPPADGLFTGNSCLGSPLNTRTSSSAPASISHSASSVPYNPKGASIFGETTKMINAAKASTTSPCHSFNCL